MPTAESHASATWQGNLTDGKGTVSTGSGALNAQTNWEFRSRGAPTAPATNPEELIGAALASCFSMAFSNGLSQNGTPPHSMDVNTTTTFSLGSGGVSISSIALDVTAAVPDIEPADFQRIANEAKDGCPVSQALKGNVDITMQAHLK